MITKEDLSREQSLKEWAAQSPSKNQKHNRLFSRDQFYYNLDEVERQAAIAARTPGIRVTYEDHIKAVKTARFMLNKDNQHDITMSILSHRWFKDYRAKAFKGNGSFREDFAFVATKVGNIVDTTATKIIPMDIQDKLATFKKATLVQINYLAGTVQEVNVKTVTSTLQEWASKFNEGASETTRYIVAGRKL